MLASHPTPERARPHLQSRVPIALVVLTLLAAVVRFATLDLQSYWYNEAATVLLAKADFGHMLELVPDHEGNPPLYYILAWLWAQVFGVGEVGLRSLSALAGTAMVPAGWWALRRAAGERAALIFAGLIAVAPLLVWYSQEARPYILVTLFVTIATGWFLRAWEDPQDGRALAAWTAFCALSLVTHYFAIFVVAAQGILLLVRAANRRRVLVAGGVLVAVMAALWPIIDQQRTGAKTSVIGGLGTRAEQLPKQLLIAFDAPAETLSGILAIALVVVAAGIAVTRADERPRRVAIMLGATGVASLVLALGLAVVGTDYVNTRNLIVALPLLLAPVAVGLSVPRLTAARLAVGGALAAVMCAAWLGVDLNTKWQRDDWRGVAAAIGPATVPRAIVVTPGQAYLPLRYYVPRARLMGRDGTAVSEVVVAGLAQRPGTGDDPVAPPANIGIRFAGFVVVQRTRYEHFTIVRYRAPTLVQVNPVDLSFSKLGAEPLVYAEPPGR